MKKNSLKEENSFHASDQSQKKNSSENIPVFLILAAIILAINFFAASRRYLLDSGEFQPADNMVNPYIWLTGSSEIPEGLYQFNPELLQKQLPEIGSLLSKPPADNTNTLVAAFDLESGKPRSIELPPQVANIFLKPIPINRADKNVLTSLPGIGPALAEKIVMRRNQLGPFEAKEELLQVDGIGPKKFAALVEHITVE